MATGGDGGGIYLRVLLLLVSLALGAWVRPAAAAPDGDAKTAGPSGLVSDSQMFTRELIEGGALKFYDATEEILRAGQFERSLLRYQFLRGRIGRQAGYSPLTAQVDHRLRFLKGQLKLGDAALVSLPLSRPRPPLKEQSPAKPPEAPKPPPKSGSGQPASASPASSQTDDANHVPTAGGPPGAPKPPKEAALPAEGVSPADKRPATAAGQAGPEPQEQAAEEPPPAPPLSRWEKLKRRLLFWKK